MANSQNESSQNECSRVTEDSVAKPALSIHSNGCDSPASSGSLFETLTFGLTLPERTARAASVLAGGVANEAAGWLLPTAFRSSKTYSAFVQESLNLLIHDVGGVPKPQGSEKSTADTALAQKAISGLLDLAGSSTLHVSPLTVLAVTSDVAYGSGHYLGRLSDELKREGVIDQDTSIDHVSDLLQALHRASDRTSDALIAPPLDPKTLAESIEQIVSEIRSTPPSELIPKREVDRIWKRMEDTAGESELNVSDVAATMTLFAINQLSLTTRGALSTVKVTGNLLDEQLFTHYRDALKTISEKGIYSTLAESSEPYLEACWHHFDADRETWTESLLSGEALGAARDWFRKTENGK